MYKKKHNQTLLANTNVIILANYSLHMFKSMQIDYWSSVTIVKTHILSNRIRFHLFTGCFYIRLKPTYWSDALTGKGLYDGIWRRANKWKSDRKREPERDERREFESDSALVPCFNQTETSLLSLPGFRVHVWRNAFINVIPLLSNKASVIWRASERASGELRGGGAVLTEEGVRGKYTPFSVVRRARRPNTGLSVQGDLHVKAPGITKGWKGAGQDLDNPFLFWWVVCFHAVRYWAASLLYPHLFSPLVLCPSFCFPAIPYTCSSFFPLHVKRSDGPM